MDITDHNTENKIGYHQTVTENKINYVCKLGIIQRQHISLISWFIWNILVFSVNSTFGDFVTQFSQAPVHECLFEVYL